MQDPSEMTETVSDRV